MTRQPTPATDRVCGGIFTPDPAIPADHKGRQTCVCHLTGQAGDAHHTPAAPAEDAKQRAAGDAK